MCELYFSHWHASSLVLLRDSHFKLAAVNDVALTGRLCTAHWHAPCTSWGRSPHGAVPGERGVAVSLRL